MLHKVQLCPISGFFASHFRMQCRLSENMLARTGSANFVDSQISQKIHKTLAFLRMLCPWQSENEILQDISHIKTWSSDVLQRKKLGKDVEEWEVMGQLWAGRRSFVILTCDFLDYECCGPVVTRRQAVSGCIFLREMGTKLLKRNPKNQVCIWMLTYCAQS